MEFAIILPVFALMLFGMIQFGLAFAGWDELRNAVNTGARLAANDEAIPPSSDCGQPSTDTDGNLVCEIAFLIGTPADTSPSPVTSIAIEPPQPPGQTVSLYGCDLRLRSCNSYAWLDGYFVLDNGQWKQIVSSTNSNPSSAEIPDQQAFDGYVRGQWSCTSSLGPNCIVMTTNIARQNPGALGSDNVALTLTSNAVSQVCAQRQVISFTGFPGLQDIHISTASTFYLSSTSLLECPNSGQTCTYPTGSTCG